MGHVGTPRTHHALLYEVTQHCVGMSENEEVVATLQTPCIAKKKKGHVKEVVRNPLQCEMILIDKKISWSITVNVVGGLF